MLLCNKNLLGEYLGGKKQRRHSCEGGWGISRSKRGPGINDNEFGDHAFCI